VQNENSVPEQDHIPTPKVDSLFPIDPLILGSIDPLIHRSSDLSIVGEKLEGEEEPKKGEGEPKKGNQIPPPKYTGNYEEYQVEIKKWKLLTSSSDLDK
jgi:hypothetical protein